MKKFNKNSIVFVLVFLLIGSGFTMTYFYSLKSCVYDLIVSLKAEGLDAFDDFTSQVDQYSQELRYHDALVDLDSLKQLCINTRLVQKGDETLVKAQENTLIIPHEHYPEEALSENVSAIQTLQLAAEEKGADFLYIAVPEKNMLYTAPENVENHSADNYSRYLKALQDRNIPVLDLYDALRQENKITADAYFKTDHHWTPETAFWATEKICHSLGEQYGFEYNSDYTNLDNYNTQVYPDWFLGAYGKKVGRFFTSQGADDITLITPKFETDLTEQQPFKNQERTGPFEQSVLFPEHIQSKDYYGLSPYSAYGGGDFRLQIITNNLNPEGKKILMVRDSFACAVTPFLSLNAGQLHIVDVRNFIQPEKLDVYEYIRQIDPDYVLVLYSGTGNPQIDHEQYVFGDPS